MIDGGQPIGGGAIPGQVVLRCRRMLAEEASKQCSSASVLAPGSQLMLLL